ncbi:hypothetical protein M406DRAFT_66889 [Cryphonectria parasitica EP155]|uniref:Retrovirus-related Pol polyprotein from transposon TNT 1-94-like beta-barrel domain-containing protein n=1 Tax=Cryphonectria parasitica (strain ATCC 38755 / EP155) TaxID=660469 RepID=A0A9P4YCE6_CRYP1|nr:uncharacterized protein M406DRAFT_66889 [Cryphonectria parasitica EP155]KAF3770486.1 hypothetical protein M406DRAFT_66889 [Cryphonectria parasitica EP155]
MDHSSEEEPTDQSHYEDVENDDEPSQQQPAATEMPEAPQQQQQQHHLPLQQDRPLKMEESTSRPWQPITHAIPVLVGEKNLEDWSVMVASTLRQMRLGKYIKYSVPEPDERKDPKGYETWNQEQGTVVTLLQSTLHKVRSTLTNAGLPVGEEDPYVIYNAVLKTIPKHSEEHIDQIATRLANCKVADYSTLQAFRDDLQYMKRRLKELKLDPPEGFLLAIVLKKIEDVLPEMHAFARRDHKLDKLTWDTLMAEINSAIITGTGNKAFSTFKKTAQTSSSSSASGGTQGGARQWPREDSLPSTGVINGVKLPKSIIERISYCCQCKRYLVSGWKHCEECSKCHGSSPRGCRTGNQSQAAQQTSTSSSTTAGPTVFGGSSVADKLATVAISALVEHDKLSRDSIIANTGASETLFNDPKWFLDLVQLPREEAMESAAGSFKIEMAGTVKFDVVRDDGSIATITLENARFFPCTPCNLISVTF